jgi:hypothetical protein
MKSRRSKSGQNLSAECCKGWLLEGRSFSPDFKPLRIEEAPGPEVIPVGIRTTLAKLALLLCLVCFLCFSLAPPLFAQSQPSALPDPSSALNDALVAACQQNQADFSSHLAGDNAAAYQNLPNSERVALLKRFSLLDKPGRPLLDSDAQGHPILRCESADATVEFKFGSPRVTSDLAYVPVTVEGEKTVQFGLLREGGKWRLLSIGLLLLDIPQLEIQWNEQEIAGRESDALSNLQAIASALDTYRKVFGKLPETLAQLGPSKGGVSPAAANLLDAGLAAGSEGGYQFRYRVISAAGGMEPSFEIAAVPAQYGKSGKRSFLLSADGKIHAADKHGAVATPDDPIISPAEAESQSG